MSCKGSTKSATRKSLHAVKFRFFEYYDDDETIFEDKVKKRPIREVMEPQVDPLLSTDRFPTYESWIYVFRFFSGKRLCTAEILVESENKFKIIDWSDRDKWRGKDVRKPGPTKKEFTLCLDEEEWVYFFLSEVQLPYQRILEYEGFPASNHLLDQRAFRVEIDKQKIDKGEVSVTLYHPMRALRQVQTMYLTKREEFEKRSPDKEEAARIHLANLVYSLSRPYADKYKKIKELSKGTSSVPPPAKEKKWGGLSQKGEKELDSFLRTKGEELAELKDYENAVKRLAKSKKRKLTSPEFKIIQMDFTGAQTSKRAEKLLHQLIQDSAYVLADSHKSKATRDYLMQMVADGDNWYVKLLLGNDDVFGPVKKTFSTTLGVTNSVLTIYEQWALAAVKRERKVLRLLKRKKVLRASKPLDAITDVLEQRLKGLDKHFKKVDGDQFFGVVKPQKGKPRSHTVRFLLEGEVKSDIASYESLRQRLQKKGEGLEKIQVRIAFALNAINLVFVWNKIEEAQGSEEWINVQMEWAAAVGELTASAEFLLARRFGTKLFRITGFVASLLTFALDFKRMLSAIEEREGWQAAGYGISAAGGALLLAGKFAGTVAASAWWTGFGFLLVFGGMIVLLMFQEDPLREWLESSPWGIKPKLVQRLAADVPVDEDDILANKEATWLIEKYNIGMITAMIHDCYKLLTRFEAKVQADLDGIDIYATFGMSTVHTKLEADLTLIRGEKRYPIFKNVNYMVSQRKIGRRTRKVSASPDDLQKKTGLKNPFVYTRYEAKIRFDLTGDGKVVDKEITLSDWIELK